MCKVLKSIIVDKIKIKEYVRRAFEECRFDPEMPLPTKRKFILSILQGENYDKEIGLISDGGILEITGREGTGKSTFMAMLVAACFQPDGVYANIKADIQGGKVLWFDTEMTGDDFYFFQRRLHNMCGLNKRNTQLISINMDVFESHRLKYEVFLDILNNINGGRETDYLQDVRLVVLDGIGDLISDTNNEKEAREVILSIKKALNQCGAALVTVLHTDKRGIASRGTLGTLLNQKATYVLKIDYRGQAVDRHEAEVLVTALKHRASKPIKPFKFSFDDDGTPMINDVPVTEINSTHSFTKLVSLMTI